jgi:hypothetical protein
MLIEIIIRYIKTQLAKIFKIFIDAVDGTYTIWQRA